MKFTFLLLCFSARFFTLYGQDYRIHFIQNGLEVPVINEHVTLAKSTFQLQVELLKVDGIFGACSLSDSLFQIPIQESLPETDLIQWKIAVEPENNADKDMIVSADSYFYWFYNPKVDTWHRFDPNPLVVKGRVIGTKTIEHLFLSEQDNTQTQNVELTAIQQPLYCIFFLMDDKSEKTFKRQRIRVDWR